jgi:hypothetical protein
LIQRRGIFLDVFGEPAGHKLSRHRQFGVRGEDCERGWISVGDGKLCDDGTRKPLQVKAGDRVLFTSYAGEQFKVSDQELLLMHEEDILAVIE